MGEQWGGVLVAGLIAFEGGVGLDAGHCLMDCTVHDGLIS